ncbi:DUF4845 domain-containing protein [Ramlibacter albus]|uniref:DUF4845 domain-containing protein n=1 Tax=Ramlibacter albus TaxID=2079448 RepID=A0A923MDI8_9BURK|nr:DUF4845 domain-containing protein [Ramlibacter albus]MBC5768378.1 DUF4845 domain-containing protein [Ramlibacter albus]
MNRSKSGQRGGMMLVLILVGLLAYIGVLGAQVFPTYMEFQSIQKAVKKAAAEGNSVAEVRLIYEKATAVEDIKSVQPKDLEVVKQGDRWVAKFAYSKEIHLFGPAYLVMKYAGSS